MTFREILANANDQVEQSIARVLILQEGRQRFYIEGRVEELRKLNAQWEQEIQVLEHARNAVQRLLLEYAVPAGHA